MTKGDRLQRVFEALDERAAARTFEEAWHQVEGTLNAMDSEKKSDKPGARRFRTLAHNVYRSDGSIEIREVSTGRTIYTKAGGTE